MVRCWVLVIEILYLIKNEVVCYGVMKNVVLNLILIIEVIMKRWMFVFFILFWFFVFFVEIDLFEFVKKYFLLWIVI